MNNKTKRLVMIFAIAMALPSLLWAAPQQPASNGSADAAAIRKFDEAIVKYMALRKRLRNEVSGPVKNSSSSQVNDASDALAGSIQRARKNAQVGSIFNAPVAALLKRRILDTIRTEKLAAEIADIDDDGPVSVAPDIHLRLPVSAQMATMPPALLNVLPVLPKELEYRIIGRNLVLRDVDASLIIDYIPGAVPR